VQFGGNHYTQKKPQAFWEVMDQYPVTASNLLAQKNGDQWLLYEGKTRTVPYSVKNNFNSIAWKS
jgi:hypothetical protein